MDKLHDNETINILKSHYKKYPFSQVTDMLKLLYQNEFGCGHMVTDKKYSMNMIYEELANIADNISNNISNNDAFEYIGNDMYRLHLHILRQCTLKPETLNGFFVFTANNVQGSDEGYEKKAALFIELCKNSVFPFNPAEVTQTFDDSRSAGHPPKRHSETFRLAYAPAYRVVSKVFYDFFSLFCKIDELMLNKERVTVAIDGCCASGKTTLANLLKIIYSCNLFTTDDFFLRPFQKTPKRLEEPGGNVDYERFKKEIILPLQTGKQFSFQAYDCQTQELSGPITVNPNPLNIIEGVYSLHPNYADSYDLTVFLTLDSKEQLRRLSERSPFLYNKFVQEWIPMENRYFEVFKICEKCDLVF